MTIDRQNLRNLAIIAHVDHGKTTLVDQLLVQSGTLATRNMSHERVMDSNDLERERGITILAKNTAIRWRDYHLNLVDTPGHADFGGEVERVLSMVDSVVLLVDAAEGPMPQTAFVTQKALSHGLKPIVVINKVDRMGADPDMALNNTFDLFVRLNATEEQLDFPVIYASAINGKAGVDPQSLDDNMDALFEVLVANAPSPPVSIDGPLLMQISALDWSDYTGLMGIGRIQRGTLTRNQQVSIAAPDGTTRRAKVGQIFGFLGLERIEAEQAEAGDIVLINGIKPLSISDCICDIQHPELLPPLIVDEPTITMNLLVNDSPFAGREGKFVTSRHLQERLMNELQHNVALRVEETEKSERFKVSGRGELHLSILIETMRREGYELAVSRPQVIEKDIDGVRCEPWENLVMDVEISHQGTLMERLGERRAQLENMVPDGQGRVRLEFSVPSRGLFGFRSEFLTITSGEGIMVHAFKEYAPKAEGSPAQRRNGVLISMDTGKAVGYALFSLQERGRLFISPGQELYEGMVVGIHSRDNDLTVNPLKQKQLTNFRASGSDENILLTPPVNITLEYAIEFINDDELVEITPKNIRVRKQWLTENERKRYGKSKKPNG